MPPSRRCPRLRPPPCCPLCHRCLSPSAVSTPFPRTASVPPPLRTHPGPPRGRRHSRHGGGHSAIRHPEAYREDRGEGGRDRGGGPLGCREGDRVCGSGACGGSHDDGWGWIHCCRRLVSGRSCGCGGIHRCPSSCFRRQWYPRTGGPEIIV